MNWLSAVVLTAWGLLVSTLDARFRRLPNALTLGAAVLGLLYLIGSGEGPLGTSRLSNLCAAGLFLAFLVPAYARHWVGGGDVKLGLAMGLLGGIQVTLVTLGAGGLLLAGLGWHASRNRRAEQPPRVVPWGTAHGIAFAGAVLATPYFPGGVY